MLPTVKYMNITRIEEGSDLGEFLGQANQTKKMDMKFGTWNVRTIYRAGSLRGMT
jgi:hypothetical protein